ncbi:MAG: aldose epimerase family protein [Bacillota bacterium]|nr:galactose mutarotase [Bacillota bacterium]MDD4264420.1 galactose mutarotase [Bacillota bacterium]
MLKKTVFGKLQTNDVFSYIITNKNGASIEILNLGGIINRLTLPTKSGQMIDIVLGQDFLENYTHPTSFIGGIVGRNSNRIANGSFNLNGAKIKLETGEDGHNLHSGSGCYLKKIFLVKEIDESSIMLKHLDQGEGGFSGSVEVSVKITFNCQNQLILEYSALPYEDTIINLTHHVYFNLNGHLSSLKNHSFQITADNYTPVSLDGIPTGEIKPVKNTAFDFTTPKLLDLSLLKNAKELSSRSGYDHNFCLNSGKDFSVASTVCSLETGLKLTCLTDQPGLQLYTGNFIVPNTPAKGDGFYGPYSGFCLETQNYPDAINQPLFPSPIYREGQEYLTKTIYEFSYE